MLGGADGVGQAEYLEHEDREEEGERHKRDVDRFGGEERWMFRVRRETIV